MGAMPEKLPLDRLQFPSPVARTTLGPMPTEDIQSYAACVASCCARILFFVITKPMSIALDWLLGQEAHMGVNASHPSQEPSTTADQEDDNSSHQDVCRLALSTAGRWQSCKSSSRAKNFATSIPYFQL